MYLTKVELQGFKSFADRTTFDFDAGITAVLGPNGCGKSNVVDAIKWVLGESSAKNLRGSQMLDVIFAGSERRKPCGMAEVNLYFNNEDGTLPVEYNEVCVSRRLYRSGESEYLINKQPSRRRDIREMFMDTGIGTSAYSFIEQGKVELLLQAKPAERRAVFEEAAGISKYKARRKETLSRLDRTNQYLLRVNDIVEEVEKNIRRVSRQAAAARRHQRLSEELKAIKSFHYIRQYRELTALLCKLQNEKDEIQKLMGDESGRQAEAATLSAELAKQELALTEEADAYQQNSQEIQDNLTKTQVESSATEERLNSIEREAKDALGRAEALRLRLANISGEIENTGRELDTAKEEAAKVCSGLEEFEGKRGEMFATLTEAETKTEELRKELDNLAESRSTLASDSARAESEETSLTEQARRLDEKGGVIDTEKQDLEGKVNSLREQVEKIATEMEGANADISELRNKEREDNERAQEITRKISSANAEMSGKSSRLSTLNDLDESLAGAFAGVKAVLTAAREGRPEFREVRGMAADLITVPSDVAIAIERTLGGQAQDIIVDSARGAQGVIEYLKRNRAGRATLLPLDRIRSRQRLDRNLGIQSGVLGEAVDLVEFDECYRPAMEYLLGGVLVVDTLTTARELSGREARGVRIVTLEGDIINPSGAMTGGNARNERGGLITRKAEKDELSGQIEEIKQEIEKLERHHDGALQGAREAAQKANELQQSLNEIIRGGQETERELSVAQSSLDRLTRESEGLGGERQSIADALSSLNERKQQFTTRREEISQRETACRSELEAYIEKQKECRATMDAIGEDLALHREKRAQTVSRAEELERRLRDMEANRDEWEAEVAKCGSFSENASSEKEALAERLQALRERERELLTKRDELRDGGSVLREKLNSLRERLSEEREGERALQKRLNEIQEALSNLKMKENEYRIKLEAVEEKALHELEIDDLAERAEEQARQEEEAEKARLEALAAQENAEGQNEESAEGEAQEQAEIFEDENAQKAAPDTDANGEELEFIDEAGVIPANATDAQLETMITDINAKLSRIGPVNMYAIEEQTELEARAEFLKSEQDDLQGAADDLIAVIDRLNEECDRKFNETFTTVRENFIEMFRKLFGGGKADLILEEVTDEEGNKNGDALDAGIDIIARPPGKEPKSISLLSGGEKALCAVALLFAIFRSKPSPFCILDEVDGPLDESNIDRFMSAVREFSAETQFILISHAKRTMGMTDTIYGVTQDEPGISTKYSLRFKNEYTGEEEKNEDNETEIIETSFAG